LKTRLSFLLLLGCANYSSGYFWQPLKCYTATWQGKGQVCSGNYSGRTCARSQAEIEEYAGKLETTLNTGRVGLSQFLLVLFSLHAPSPLCPFSPLFPYLASHPAFWISRLPSLVVLSSTSEIVSDGCWQVVWSNASKISVTGKILPVLRNWCWPLHTQNVISMKK
jgi:hypothetical protein